MKAVRRMLWRAFAQSGMTQPVDGVAPKSGVYIEKWKGPNGELALVPVRDNGQIATLDGRPLYVQGPEAFAEAMSYAWQLLHGDDAPLPDDVVEDIAHYPAMPPAEQALQSDIAASLVDAAIAASAPTTRTVRLLA